MKMKKRIKNTLEFIGLLMYQSRLIQTMFFVSLYEFDTKNILLQKRNRNNCKNVLSSSFTNGEKHNHHERIF